MNKKLCYVIFLWLLFFTSCEKELDFQYHDIEPQFVIEGILSETGAIVKLTETVPMNEKIENRYITDAEVQLIDINDSKVINLISDSEGIFGYDFIPVISHEYTLKVNRNGKEYSSYCEMRRAPTILDMLFQWIKMPYDYVAVLQITFMDLESQNDCYWIRIYRNDEPYKWIVADDKSAVDGVINEVVMTSRKDLEEEDEKDILRDGDKVKVTLNTISREMYDYLIAIENDSNGPSMFEGDYCLGYFMASGSTSDSIIFHPDEITQYE